MKRLLFALTIFCAAATSGYAQCPLDTTPPTVHTQDITVQLGATGVASIVPTDVDNGSTDNCAAGILSYSLDISSFSCTDVGTPVTVTLTVTDAQGNSAMAPAIVTVEDSIPPTVLTQDITVQLDAFGFASIVPTDVDNGSTDNCTIFSYSLDISSFSCTDVGTPVTVTLTVTDTQSNSAMGTAIVTVEDNIAPAITCPGNIVVAAAPGDCGAVVTYTPPVGTDNCTGATTIQTAGLASGSVFPSGLTTNIFQTTDASGNVTTCSFTVSVTDNQIPAISCPADISVSNDPGDCGAIVNFAVVVGTDNCTGSTTVQTSGLAPGSFFPVGTTINTYKITDATGNTATCSFNVVVNDTEFPSLFCPADISVNNDPGICGAVVTYSTFLGTDNCFGAATTQTAGMSSGSIFPVGTTTNTFKTTDAAGNVTICSFNVVVTDVEPPAITCLPNIVVSNDAGDCGAVVTYTPPVGTDNCTSSTTVQIAGLAPGSFFPIGTTTNTFQTTDTNGNTTSCSFDVIVNDTEAPIAVCQNISVILDATGNASITVAAINNGSSDNCGIASTSIDILSFDCSDVGANTVTLTVTDVNGNVSTCTSTVTVIDNIAPIASCQNITVQLDATGNASIIPADVDNGSSDVCGIASTSLDISSFTCADVGTPVTVTLSVTDNAGNVSTCTATVTVEDNLAPAIACPSNITTNNDIGTCGAVVTYTTPAGTDNCTSATTTQIAGLASGSVFPIGTTTNTFQTTDASGNVTSCSFDVIVTDSELPVIACPTTNITVNNDAGTCGAVVTYTAIVGTDNCTGATTIQTAGLASGSVFPIGTTTNTFQVTDASGNVSTCSFDVIVTDNELPVIACPGNITVNNDAGTCGAVVTYTAIVGTDNCTGSTTIQTAGLASGSVFPVGTTTNTFQVTDASGNVSTCSFDVIVNDNELPAIACPGNISVNNDAGTCGAVVTYTAPVGTDNCTGSTTIQTAGLASGSVFPIGTTTNTFQTTDATGNVSTCSFDVIVTDNELPAIACPGNISVNNDAGTCGAVVTYTAIVGTDNCAGSTTIQTAGLASGSVFPIGTTTNTFQVTDASGNVSTCSFDVIVNDNESPVISCIANITANSGSGNCGAMVTYATPVGTDNCPGSTTIQIAGLASGSIFPVGTTTNTFEVTDASGNVSTCSFDVIVTDTVPPILVCPADIIVSNDPGICGAVVNYGVIVGADNCTGAGTSQTAGLPTGSVFPVGTTLNTFQSIDASGNITTCSFNVIVNDTEAPVLNCPADISVVNDPGDCGAIVTYAVFIGIDNCTGAVTTQTGGLASGTLFPVGTTTNTYETVDLAGNVTTCSFDVTVTDTEAPALVCPSNIIVNSDIGVCGAVVSYTTPVGTDNCTGVTTIMTAGLASGSTFPIGTTTMTFVATDATGQVTTCSFDVTVNDTEAPLAICQNITVQLDATGNASIVAADVDNGSSDACGIASTSIDITSFDCTNVGPNNVTLTVTDNNGNVSTCTSIVTVVDNVAPVAACQNITVRLDITRNASISGTDVDNASSDACGIASLSVAPNTFNLANLGPNTVTLTVTDNNSNTATCTATVTVLDFAYIYENGAWTPGDPSGVATTNDDILVINGTTALTVDTQMNDLTINAGATLNIQQVIYPSGNITNDGSLVFVNDGLNLGQLADMTGSTITGIGTTTVQRYIPKRDDSKAAFRYITSAANSVGSINANWQEGAATINDNPNPGFGMFITGSTTGANGFDATAAGAPSMFGWDGSAQGYVPVPNTNVDNLVAGVPYVAYVWGDRSVDIVNNADPVATNTTLRSTGSLLTGNQLFSGLSPVSLNYNLIGNPYQAIVDMDDVMANSTNLVTAFYYVWDPNLSSRGAFALVLLNSGGTVPSTSDANQYLQPGQSVFVLTANDQPASILFEESDKDVTQTPTDVFKPLNTASIELQLFQAQSFVSGGPLADALQVNFTQGGSNAILLNDAPKLWNFDENVCLVNGNSWLAYENRALPTDGETLQLFNNQYRAGDYTFKAILSDLPKGTTAYLKDDYLGIQTKLDNNTETLVNFSVDVTVPASIDPNRFSIVFASKGLSSNDVALSGFSLYPNPVKGDSFFVVAPEMAGQNVNVTMYDLLGRRVHSVVKQIGSNNRIEVNAHSLQSGVYVVEVSHNGKTFTQKLIVE